VSADSTSTGTPDSLPGVSTRTDTFCSHAAVAPSGTFARQRALYQAALAGLGSARDQLALDAAG
jgi:hypothetical protein